MEAVKKIAECVLDDEFPPKQVFLCSVPSLTDLPAALNNVKGQFVLFIAVDAVGIGEGAIYTAGKSLLDKGMVYACLWGGDCERVHDIFDAAIVEQNPAESQADVVLTTWHSKDTLKDAVEFFLYAAWPAKNYEQACQYWIAAVIDNPEWAQLVTDTICGCKAS